MSAVGCWECSQKNGHAATGGSHPHYWCKPERCPDRMKHAERVYGSRFTTRYGGMTRDGVTIIPQIDGVDASKTHQQKRCVCGLLLIWTPRHAPTSADSDDQEPVQ